MEFSMGKGVEFSAGKRKHVKKEQKNEEEKGRNKVKIKKLFQKAQDNKA